MIIETHDDVVRLSGSLQKNQWIAIKAAANLLLTAHPQGIIVDCGMLGEISKDGARTFLDAMRDIEAADSRIIVANLPANLLDYVRSVPGVRSSLPIADSVEAARASLRMACIGVGATAPSATASKGGTVILVPLLGGMDLSYGASLAARLARGGGCEIQLVYFLEVNRQLPLNAPLEEDEQVARDMLERALQSARQIGAEPATAVERVRDASEGIIAAVKAVSAGMVVLGAATEPSSETAERFRDLVQVVLQRVTCEVVIGRLRPGN